ncbi:unnamed protein product [Diatraea saccharalis]|uniref:Uncharacterized protein n=1 Tax=Diatraea saccharalis TaxID=40085 RepID=A0A9N9WJM9_9NEOP|nr:unnamed protein product [Diatraea saccharalis]
MLMSLAVYIIITYLTLLSKGAPKLGHLILDSLLLESSNLNGENDLKKYRFPTFIGRRDTNNEPEPKTAPCHGYDYDDMKCKMVNNRILCGYNKNNGELKGSNEIVDMGGDCRMRNDRIECGYFKGPYDGKKLPPHFDKMKNKSQSTRTYTTETLLNKLIGKTDAFAETEPRKISRNTEQTPPASIIGRSYNKTKEAVNSTTNINKTEVPTVSTTADETEEYLENDNITNSNTEATKNTIVYSSSISTAQIITLTNSPVTTQSIAHDEKSTRYLNTDKSITNATNTKEPHITKEINEKPVTLCVEKQDRIVCYDTKQFLLLKKTRRSS